VYWASAVVAHTASTSNEKKQADLLCEWSKVRLLIFLLFSVGFICAAPHPVESYTEHNAALRLLVPLSELSTSGFVCYPKTTMVLLPFCLFVKQEVLVTANSLGTLLVDRNKPRCYGTGYLSSILGMKRGGLIL
jgi:hypothetical protein